MTDTLQTGTRPTASAHRGDASRYRENTIPAIRSAIAKGAEFVEIDVRLTSDGKVVLLHDPTLARLWDCPAPVAELSWREVARLGDAENRIPLLSEVLPLFENSTSTVLIDMETGEPAAAAFHVAAQANIAIAWCGHLDGMRTIRSLDPKARIWMPWNQADSPTAGDIAGLAPEYVNSDFRWMTRAKVERIHALGCKVAVWTVDDEATMRWVLGLGVDCVTSNRLSSLQQVIDQTSNEELPARSTEPIDIARAIATAKELGEWAIDFARSTDPGRIATKENPADLVTEVDVAVEHHVREVIGERFPRHGFVGEEMGGAAAPGVPCWYLDPVDGTTNFASRIPWNAFSLALAIDDVPLVGVVADPWRGDLFSAVRNQGAYLNGTRLTTEPATDPADDPLSGQVVATELAAYLAWPGMTELLTALGKRYCTMRIMGSGTMTLVGIAAGRGVGSVIGTFSAPDHLAAALIVEEAGGIILDSRGRRNPFPDSGGILAASPAAATDLYDVWRAAVETAGNPDPTPR